MYTLLCPCLCPPQFSRDFCHSPVPFPCWSNTGSKGKMGIQQPLSSPILFHLQKTNFSSYLIYKIMSNLAMQQYCTQLSFPFIIAGI